MSSLLAKDSKELIIIDGNIGDIENIPSGLKENQWYIVLSGGNGFAPLLEYLEISGTEWSAFHFITHGNDASFMLNGTTISHDNLCSDDWLNIGKYLTDDGDILLYGCNIATSDGGKALVNAIAALTGADTAASVDITGFGGNNILEYHSGTIESISVLPGTFSRSLEVITRKTEIPINSSQTFTNTTFSLFYSNAVENQGTFTANSCTFRDSTVPTWADDGGGAVHNDTWGMVTANNCSFSNNSAGKGGAVHNKGTLTANNCSFSNNSASQYGGAVYNDTRGMVTANNCSFSNNSADEGGAVYNNNSTFTATSCSFSNNSADEGGAVYNDTRGMVTANNCSFSNNSASQYGGAVYNNNSTFTATSCSFSNNSDTSVYNDTWGTATVNNCMFSNNSGIAMYNNNSTFTANNCTISKNSGQYGGAVYNNVLGTFTANNCSFSENTWNDGTYVIPAISNAGMFTANNCTFSKNSGYSVVENTGGTFTANNCAFSKNSGHYGGAIYNDFSGTFIATSCTFSGNTATHDGGAVYNGKNNTVFLNDCVFETENDTIYNEGTLILSGANIFGGTVTNEGTLVFDLNSMTSVNEFAIINDFSKFSDNGKYSIRISEDQTNGTYRLVENAANFNKTVSLRVGSSGTEIKIATYDAPKFFDGFLCKLEKNQTLELLLTVTGTVIVTDEGTTDTLTINGVEYTGEALKTNELVNALANYRKVATLGITSKTCLTVQKGFVFAADNVNFASGTSNSNGAVNNQGTVSLNSCSFAMENDTVFNADTGTLILSGANTFGGFVTNEGTVVIDLSSKTSGNETLIVNDFSKFSGKGNYSVKISDKHELGTYLLAGNADTFTGSISVTGLSDFVTGYETTLVLGVNVACEFNGKNYTLLRNDENQLFLQISKNAAVTGLDMYHGESPREDNCGVTWDSTGERPATAVFSMDGSFSGVLSVIPNGNVVMTYGAPMTGVFWGVKSDGDMIQTASWTISGRHHHPDPMPSRLTAEKDGFTDLFFAGVLGQWEKNFVAKHTGTHSDNENSNGWEGTGERVYLAGRNKIGDTITGASDANILVLTDDANGDALFIDDLYTDVRGNDKNVSRLSQIHEIRAGAGNDVVDLTSSRFSYTSHQNGLTVRGGSGDDVIWANDGSNSLFGDDGDDRIVGGNGNDVISGGSGNDRLHGGGGNDVFTFCENWGEDTVMQLYGGSVTLWFADGSKDKWDAKKMTYRDGSNSVTVSGVRVDDITLKFGDDGSEEYDRLSAQGAFSEKTSEKIFETDKTLLA